MRVLLDNDLKKLFDAMGKLLFPEVKGGQRVWPDDGLMIPLADSREISFGEIKRQCSVPDREWALQSVSCRNGRWTMPDATIWVSGASPHVLLR